MTETPQTKMSDAELEVLKVLWEHGRLGIRDLWSNLTTQGKEWSRSTVITLVQRLEAKGYVSADRKGRAFVYHSLVTREQVMHSRIEEVAGDLSNGESMPLILACAEKHRFTKVEIERLRSLVEDLKRRSSDKR